MNNHYYVYIMASNSGVLYIGVINDLGRRVWEHREGVFEGFSKEYNCKKLVYYEYGFDINNAIAREKQLKKWRREKKEILINKINKHWNDLSLEMFDF